MTLEVISRSDAETYELGRRLGTLLEAGDLLALSGDLGAGKTCCIQGIACGLGVEDRRIVTSPTFTLIQEYQGRLPIYHFDVYRIDHEDDLYDLGYEEYFYGEGVTLIEWAERIPGFLPAEHLVMTFHIHQDLSRSIRFTAYGEHFCHLLQHLAQE